MYVAVSLCRCVAVSLCLPLTLRCVSATTISPAELVPVRVHVLVHVEVLVEILVAIHVLLLRC